MDLKSPIYVFSDSIDGKEYIASDTVTIALSIELIDGKTEDAIIGPYALSEQAATSFTPRQFRRAELRLELGRYLTEPELAELKNELWPLIEAARDGYIDGGFEENGVDRIAEFTEEAEEAIEAIKHTADEFRSKSYVPPHPAEAREDGVITPDDVSADSTDSELEEVARSFAEESLVRMHPGDTLLYLESLRDELRSEI